MEGCAGRRGGFPLRPTASIPGLRFPGLGPCKSPEGRVVHRSPCPSWIGQTLRWGQGEALGCPPASGTASRAGDTEPICCPVLGHNCPFMLPVPRGYTRLAPGSRDPRPGDRLAWVSSHPCDQGLRALRGGPAGCTGPREDHPLCWDPRGAREGHSHVMKCGLWTQGFTQLGDLGESPLCEPQCCHL